MDQLRHALETFIVLSVVIDPIGTCRSSQPDRGPLRRGGASRGLQSILVAGGLIGIFALVGRQILAALGIGLPALQVAGGLLLVLIALDLLRPQDTGPRPGQTGNVAFVPLGTPLLAGPGAIATKIRPAPRGSGRLRGAPASV